MTALNTPYRAANAWGSGARLAPSIVAYNPSAFNAQTADTTIITPSAIAYRGAGQDEKTLSSWSAPVKSADGTILPEKRTLEGRSHDLIRNNGYAAGAEQTYDDNIIGAKGLRLAAKPNWRALGKTEAWATQFAAEAEALYESFAHDARECDYYGVNDLADQSSISFKGVFADGDSFMLPHWDDTPGRIWRTRLQGIEAHRVRNPMGQGDTDRLRGGIELDSAGRPIAAHISTPRPGDSPTAYAYGFSYNTERIPLVTDWGRRRLIHLIKRRRYGQNRGVGRLAPILAQFKQLDMYLDYEMKNQMLNTLIGMVIETPVEDLLGLFSNQEQALTALGMRKPPTFDGGGQVIQLKPGEKMSPYSPNRPGAQLESFVLAFTRELCAATNLPYELFTKDFSKSSYVGIRAGLAEAYRFFSGERYWFATGWNQPIYELIMEEAVNAGRIDAPGFYQNIKAYCRAQWLGAGRGYTDRVKEVTASALAVKSRLSTLEIECAEQGLAWREVIDQIAIEEAYAEEKNVSLETDPAMVAAASAPQVDPANDDKPNTPDATPAKDKQEKA